MAKIGELDQQAWDKWVETRPKAVRDLCRRFPGNRLYLYKPTNHRVTIYSYHEDGTLTVNVTGEYNLILFNRTVFGIKPDELEECDLPGNDVVTGAALTERRDIDAYIDTIRNRLKFKSGLIK